MNDSINKVTDKNIVNEKNNKCFVCDGSEPSYLVKKCEKHDVCNSCAKPRKELTEAPWGTKDGFICVDCEFERKRKAIIDYNPNNDIDHDYLNEPTCPNCGDEYQIDDRYQLYSPGETELQCQNCGSPFKCETFVSYNYSTSKIND